MVCLNIMQNQYNTLESKALDELKEHPLCKGLSSQDTPNFVKLLSMYTEGKITADQWLVLRKKIYINEHPREEELTYTSIQSGE